MSSESGSRPSTSGGIRTIPLDPGLCRNVTIHGYCKWADKGCRFSHPDSKGADSNLAAKLRPDTPTFMPGGVGTTGSSNQSFMLPGPSSSNGTIAIGAPVFVPRGGTSSRSCPIYRRLLLV